MMPCGKVWEERPAGGLLSISIGTRLLLRCTTAIEVFAERTLRPGSPDLREKHSPLRQSYKRQIQCTLPVQSVGLPLSARVQMTNVGQRDRECGCRSVSIACQQGHSHPSISPFSLSRVR